MAITYSSVIRVTGLLPINYTNSSNALFFIFQPTISDEPCDEVTIYLNGGPGWSSFESFFQETGRYEDC